MHKKKSLPVQRMINHFGSGNKTAKALGVTYQAVSLWLHNKRIPSPEMALKAQKLSNGEIKASDLNPVLKGLT